ncbi:MULTISPECIES: site-specific integrase [Kitasatospora]|uniref:site-specific integrase n=1 Tax=Kitasatospora TaxID=2063 RepID=UPI000AC3F9A3|nr:MULTISPECIES: site-specific integrase [Kitasatospora]
MPRSVFDDDIWHFTEVQGLSQQHPDYAKQLDFTGIRNPRWRLIAKEYFFARLAPWHERVRELAHAFRTPLGLETCYQRILDLTGWLNWLDEHRVPSLEAVTQQHCTAYYQWCSDIRDKEGAVVRPSSDSTRVHVVLAIVEPFYYNELFTADAYRPGFLPWDGRTAHSIAGKVVTKKNKTPALDQSVVQPMLAAALYVIQTLGPHLLALPPRALAKDVEPGPSPTDWRERIEDVIRGHIEGRVALEALPSFRIDIRLARKTWSADDPLLAVNLNAIAQEAGIRTFRPHWVTQFRPLIEHALGQVGTQAGWGLDAVLVPRADGAGEVPWTLPLTRAQDLDFLIEKVRTACLLVIAAVTGMRSSELMELPVDCALPLIPTGPGRLRYRLASRLIKGQPRGGKREEWVTVQEPHDAAILSAALLGQNHGQTHLYGRVGFNSRYKSFRDWVNGPEGQRLGLAPIPETLVNLRRLRRTLAVELAHRPGGLLAAKIHLKHVSVATTEGYAALPGGAQGKFLAEMGEEEQQRNNDLTLEVFRDFQQGQMPAGPGARSLVEFFTHVDGQLEELAGGAPNTKGGDQEVINLLSRRAATLHLATANYCWFVDPAKALCLKLAGNPGATKPMAGMCDSSRCPQATHHLCHRPVWASSAETKTVFIGSIGRGQKAEKTRLQGELERDLRVLAEIDAATGSAA